MQLAPGDPWAAYARTVVEVRRPLEGDVVVRAALPGAASAWPWASAQAVHILTAWDPGDERPGDEENRARQSALEDELRLRAGALWSAVGLDPWTGHREEGVVASGIAEGEVLALGARYRQDAVFVWTPEEWIIAACTGGRRLALGWSLDLPGPNR